MGRPREEWEVCKTKWVIFSGLNGIPIIQDYPRPILGPAESGVFMCFKHSTYHCYFDLLMCSVVVACVG